MNYERQKEVCDALERLKFELNLAFEEFEKKTGKVKKELLFDYSLSIWALEKQKRAQIKECVTAIAYICPSCDGEVECKDNYCKHCGQYIEEGLCNE